MARNSTETRDRIVREAAELFAVKGYAATSIRDIGSAVGVSSAALYHHFTTKQAIVGELAATAASLLAATVERTNALPTGTRAHAVLTGFLDTFADHGRIFLPLLSDPSCLQVPEVRQSLLGARTRVLEALEDTITGPDRTLRATMALSALRGALEDAALRTGASATGGTDNPPKPSAHHTDRSAEFTRLVQANRDVIVHAAAAIISQAGESEKGHRASEPSGTAEKPTKRDNVNTTAQDAQGL
ncbi:MAG: TetR/AcrR family transcriptional regulator [Rhodoglobus sp.]